MKITPKQLDEWFEETHATIREANDRLITLSAMWYEVNDIPRPKTKGIINGCLHVTFEEYGRFYVHNGDWMGVYKGDSYIMDDWEDEPPTICTTPFKEKELKV